jgi:hypothetical protein
MNDERQTTACSAVHHSSFIVHRFKECPFGATATQVEQFPSQPIMKIASVSTGGLSRIHYAGRHQMSKLGRPISKHIKAFESPTPFDEQRVGAAAVYCSDGRFGDQMDEFLHQSLGLPRYDRVAVPGGAACMAGHMMVYHEAAALDRQLSFLITSHALNKVVLIAHENCWFYKGLWLGTTPLEQQQAEDLQKAAHQIRSHHPRVEVEAYFARKVEGKVRFEKWEVKGVAIFCGIKRHGGFVVANIDPIVRFRAWLSDSS